MDKWKTAARGRGKAHTRRTLKALALRKRVSCKSTCRPGALCLPKRACFWRRKEVKCSYKMCIRDSIITAKVENGEVVVTRPNDEKEARSLHEMCIRDRATAMWLFSWALATSPPKR